MKILARFAFAATLLVGCTMFAKADTVVWTLSDVVFNDGATVSGWFETDSTDVNNYINEFDLSVTGGTDPSLDFTIMSSDSNPQEFDYAALGGVIGFGQQPGFSPFVALFVDGTLSATGGTYSLTDGFLCPGCATLVSDGHSPSVAGVLGGDPPSPTPEPSQLPLLGLAVVGVGAMVRRKFSRSN
jgi:PEP-CTERM motif